MNFFPKCVFSIFTFITAVQVASYAKTPEETFTQIYENKDWGVNEDEGLSGSGASVNTTVEYRAILQNFLKNNQIHSVVDVGCGDWVWSRTVDWSGVSYIGFDVVKSVIESNQKKYANENIQFVHADILKTDLPQADLLLCKDVLQHLTIEDILSILSQFSKFKYCIIQNDIAFEHGDPNHNKQIERGKGRTLDLTKPPFNLYAIQSVQYKEAGRENTKQILVIQNKDDLKN